MRYTMAEQETVLVYNRETDVWMAYSNVPKHIRRLASIVDIQPVETGEDGEVVAVRAELTEKQIRFAAPRQLTDEQRQALRERAQRMRLKRGTEEGGPAEDHEDKS
ncbi:hypothetical protein [Brevibacillus thermoruber]|uniref:hypothetical protein n=1 Tax=Brevibacillus thermoruber TaxID=33942 RepID=UPI00068BB679|nr:hypothetical protein [Brevibacillus thermoruber]